MKSPALGEDNFEQSEFSISIEEKRNEESKRYYEHQGHYRQ